MTIRLRNALARRVSEPDADGVLRVGGGLRSAMADAASPLSPHDARAMLRHHLVAALGRPDGP